MQLFKPNVEKLKAKRDTAGLIRALRSDDEGVRVEAAYALGQVGDASAVEPLAGALSDTGRGVRELAAASLTKLGESLPAAVAALTLGLEDESLRQHVADELNFMFGRIGDDERTAAANALAASLATRARRDRDLPHVRPGAAEWILSTTRRGPDHVGQAAASAMVQIGDARAVGALRGAVENKSVGQEVQRAALVALGKIGNAGAVDALVGVARSANTWSWCRRDAIAVLAEIGDRRALEPLIAALGDPDESLRRTAVDALGELGDPAAAQALTDALSDTDSRVRQQAREVLQGLGKSPVGPLIATLGDPQTTTDVREDAARALGEIGDARAIEPLASALEDNEASVRRAAAVALRRMGDARADAPLASAIDAALKRLFSSPGEGALSDELRDFVPVSMLSEDVATWAARASGYDTGSDPNQIHYEHIDLAASDDAIAQLCRLDSPVTSNILRLVAHKRPASVRLTSGDWDREEAIDFEAQRDRARAELRRRGEPPYDADAYVKG